ncbi:DoxX family protein [Xanthomonas maliensis]|uniref:DoxX family protein n=1 Tax=Xanthomonas maliensis TaxID=1321368 RepID=UPI0012658DEA|nr:DoxX family protein [Xanthomonas maliensis]KAB7768316.1 hypothetical protein CKY51_09490 [Xanthomonas maliensis]
MSSQLKPTAGKPIRVFLWIAQFLLAAVFIMSGLMKFFTPIPELAAQMPWTGQVSETFVRFIGLIDLAGGIGVLLPALTRVLPRMTPVAAFCATILQVLAIGFHASRGEFQVLPLNFVLISLAIFILWGRWKKAPIAPFQASSSAPLRRI